jgi:tetratricopeptide (TPR) repeat protein
MGDLANVADRHFVGRETELEALAARLAEARAGRGGFVLLVGEAGIGKTRTAEELIAREVASADRILWGRCAEQEGAPAYWPWVQVLRSWADHVDDATMRADLGPGAADLTRLLPSLRERVTGIATSEVLEPAQARFRVLDAVGSWLHRIAERAPVVLILDDLHWADEDSLVLLRFVAVEMRTAPVLLIGTCREEAMRRDGPLRDTAPIGDRIPLRGLDRSAVEAFVRGMMPRAPSPAVVDHLLRTTEGNPFFLDELLRVLRDEGALERADVGVGLEIPDQVRDAVRRHLRPLSPEDRQLLGIAAVLGREFDFTSWQRICDLPPEHLLDRLGVATQAGLVTDVPDTLGRFRFRHALIRETIYADLGPADRTLLHRRVALALEGQHAGAPHPPYAELAHHFFQAAPLGEGAKAVEYALKAGERAAVLAASTEAVQHFERALAALSFISPDGALEGKVLLALGDAQWGAGDFGGARRTFERAARAARGRRDAEGLARSALALSRVSPEMGSINTPLVTFLEDALRLLDDEDSVLRASLLARLARALYFSTDTARREAISEEAVAMARRLGHHRALMAALVMRHALLWRADTPLAERLALAVEIERMSSSRIDEFTVEGQTWRVLDLLELGDIAAADREIDHYFGRCEQKGGPVLWHAMVVRATRALMIGRLDRGIALAAEALSLRQEGLASLPAQFYAAQLYVPFRELRRLDELEEPYAAFARAFPALQIWRAMLALVRAEGGRQAGARHWLDQLAGHDFTDLPRDGNFIATVCHLAELVALLRDAPRARLLAPLLAPFAERHVIVAVCAGSLGSAARYCGLLAETSGELDSAIEHFEHALAANARFGTRVWLARTQLDCARALCARAGRGDRERAARLLDEAATHAAELGLLRLGEQVASFRASAFTGASVSEPTVAGPVVAELRHEGDYWIIAHGGGSFQLRDTKGLTYLATLLRHPGRDFHVLDLAGAAMDPDAAVGATQARDAGLTADGGHAGEMLDAQARSEYKHRLEELREELAEAQAFNDRFRAGRVQEEIEALAGELARGMGLGGRARKAASHAERARLNVTRAIGSAIKKIGGHDAALGRYLEASVSTGIFCSHAPLPGAPVVWTV